MSDTVTLRTWQREALDAFDVSRSESFLAVACPGAGKTTFALAAVRRRLDGRPLPIIVVVPTQHLKHQWSAAAARFGLHLDPEWSATDGRLPTDMHGIVVTYAQAARSAPTLARMSRGGIAILDEIHHAASERTWGSGVEHAVAGASTRLLLSGTPFRTDDHPIPYVTYSFGDYGDAVPDYEYGYGEALADGGVVRPVHFPRFDGHMEWINSDGDHVEGTFDDDLLRTEWSARLRTALSIDGEWLPTVLDRAHHQLLELRRTHPDAGGLVIAADHEHARGIADRLERHTGRTVRVALSDDPRASHVISRFADSDEPWIVAVRMISEGVDIPRLRVGVYATTTTTAMFFRQAVGRIARWTPGISQQRAYMYLPDDPRLRSHAADVARQRRHSIEAHKRRDDDPLALDEPNAATNNEEQLSLFMPLAATILDNAPGAIDETDNLDDSDDGGDRRQSHPVDLPPPPPLPGRGNDTTHYDTIDPTANAAELLRTRKEQKKLLRERNADQARELVRMTGMSHAQVNGRLNRDAGIAKITEATLAQLERRLRVADSWIRRLTGTPTRSAR